MENFPSKLPAPLGAVAFEGDSSVLRTNMESGRVRQRRIASMAPRRTDLRWLMTDDQHAIFCAWHKFKISEGADSFTINLPVKGGVGNLQTCTVRIVDGLYSDSWDNDSCMWMVQCKIEIDTPPFLTESELNVALAS